jgi:myosin heavy subunit
MRYSQVIHDINTSNFSLKGNSFTIRHFAETVTYERSLFGSDRIPKKIPSRLLRLLSGSKNPILSQEFGRLLSGHEYAAKRVIKRRSRTETFNRELRDLMVQIRSCRLHFVRCIKMHGVSRSSPEAFRVLQQIQYAGLHAAALSVGELGALCDHFEKAKQIEAAFVLTAWAVKIVARLKHRREIWYASSKLSSWFRCRVARKRYDAKKHAAVTIARWIRYKTRVLRSLTADDKAQSSSLVGQPRGSSNEIFGEHPDAKSHSGKTYGSSKKMSVENPEAKSMKLLVEELQQNILHLEMHNQGMEIEFEERLAEYELEVLVLRQQLEVSNKEKAALRTEMEASDRNVRSLKDEIRRLQESHKGYLEKVVRAVEKANAEHSKSVEAMKQSRDYHLAQLEAEVESLRQRQSLADLTPSKKHEKIKRLARKLEKIMSPTFISEQLSSASSRPIPVDTIEECVSSNARNILYRLEDLCAISQGDCTSQEANVEVNDMDRRLVCAYEEIEMLSSELRRQNKAASPKKRRGIRTILSKSVDV